MSYRVIDFDELKEGEEVLAFGNHVFRWDFETMGNPAYAIVPNTKADAEHDAAIARAEAAEARADRLQAALILCLPYAQEDIYDPDTLECSYCGGDGDGEHKPDCKQVSAYLAAKAALKGGEE